MLVQLLAVLVDLGILGRLLETPMQVVVAEPVAEPLDILGAQAGQVAAVQPVMEHPERQEHQA